MTPPRFIPARILITVLVGIGVFALGFAVALNRGGSPSLSVVGTAAAPSPTPSATPGPKRGQALGGAFGVSAGQVLGVLAKDTGETPMQIITDIKNGKTLDDIAGAHAVTVKADALAAVQKGLDAAVTRGVFTKDQETHLLADAKDAIDQIMAAKLGAGGLGSLGGRGVGGPLFGGPFGPGNGRHHGPAASPSPSAPPSA